MFLEASPHETSLCCVNHSARVLWMSTTNICIFRFRWEHGGHVVHLDLPVLGSVTDSARGLGGAARELCDLLQGKRNQLQGESTGRQARTSTCPHAG